MSRASSDPTKVFSLRERMDKNTLDRNEVALAAYLGDASAIQALDEIPTIPQDLATWTIRLREAWGREACVRTALAWARAALLRWDKPRLPEALFRLKNAPHELVLATEIWALDPNEIQARNIGDLYDITAEEPRLLADQDELLLHAGIVSIAVNAAACACKPDFSQAFTDVRQDAELLWRNKFDLLKRLAAVELIPWALHEPDVLALNPTHLLA